MRRYRIPASTFSAASRNAAAPRPSAPHTSSRPQLNQALSPIPIQVSVTTAGTRGLIAKAIILHGDKVFGDVGLELRPQGNTFGTGSAAIVPATAMWSGQLGVSVTSVVTANASISMDLHLDTGIGGGAGNSLKLDATASANVPLHASFEKRSISQGTAILIQPTVSCSPGIVDVHPGVSPAFSLAWVVVSRVGRMMPFFRDVAACVRAACPSHVASQCSRRPSGSCPGGRCGEPRLVLG